MQHGLVALIDALGFRGIWAQFSADQLLATLRRIRTEALQHDPEIHVKLLSDTIVLASNLTADADPDEAGYELVFRFVRAVAAVQATAALSNPPLLYRGCMAYGSVLIDDDFVVGQAVDEAAEWMEQAEGAFIWLAPSAVALYRASNPSRIAEQIVALEHDVPLRNGRKVRTVVVNPLAGHPQDSSAATTADLHRVLAANMSQAFERPGARMSVEVLIKKQHTDDFLSACVKHSEWVVEAEAALRRSMWGGVDPLEDPSVLDRMRD